MNKLQEIKENAVHTKCHDFFTEMPYEDFLWLIERAEEMPKVVTIAEDAIKGWERAELKNELLKAQIELLKIQVDAMKTHNKFEKMAKLHR